MKKLLLAAAALSLGLVSSASAQYVERTYDDAGIWVVNRLAAKPGQFNAYLKYWRDIVLPRIEIGKQNGHILSYHILQNINVREGEPNLIVMVKYKDMASYDQPASYFEAMDKRLAGSMEARYAQMASARELADFKGQFLYRELTPKK